MVYLDTSLILALFLNESKTRDAWSWLNQQRLGVMMISDWTITELSSALAIKRRMKNIDQNMHQAIILAVRQFSQSQLGCITPDQDDFSHAASLCNSWDLGLRAGDALHVAIANRRGMAICTLDGVMQKAAEDLGIAVETP